MSGYKFHRTEQPVQNNGEPVVDGGNAQTTYLVQFDNGTANNTTQTNPVRLDFGAAT